jgi:hypothetical protein
MSDEGEKKADVEARGARSAERDESGGDGGKEENVEEVEVPALSALLKRSLTPQEPASAEPAKDEAEQERALLVGVQRKLRQRSKGKFYADGWSTTASRVNYALVAAVMLVVIVAVYLAMGPMGISFH